MCSTPPIRVIHSSPAQRDKSLTSLVLIQYFKVMRFLLEEGKKKKRKKTDVERMISCIPASGEDLLNRQSLWKSILSSTLTSTHINLFHRSNSRGRFATLSLTLSRRDISSLSARLNQYREQRYFRPSSPPDPDYDKHTQTHMFRTQMPSVTYWSASLWQSPWPRMLDVRHSGSKLTAS